MKTNELEPVMTIDRSTLLAEMAALNAEPEPVKDPAPDPAPDPEPEKGEDPEGDDDIDTDDDADTDEDIDADDIDEDASPEPEADPETAKRLSMVQDTERRMRESHERDRAAFNAEKAQWEADRADLQKAKTWRDDAAKRFRADPVDVAAELGIDPDDFEFVAEQFFRHSKKAQEDPRHKDTARLARLERRLAESERIRKQEEEKSTKERQEAAESADRARAATEYMGEIESVAKRSKIAGKLMSAMPDVVRLELQRTAIDMLNSSKERPTPKQVVKAFIRQRKAEYKAQGFDIGAQAPTSTPAPQKSAPKDAPAPVAEPPRSFKNREDEREAILTEMRESFDE